MEVAPVIPGLVSPSPVTVNPAISYAKVVQNKKSLIKYDLNVSAQEDGVGSIMVPEEVFEDPSPLWEDFLIGKFLDTALHVAKIHVIVNKIWALGD